MKDTPKEVDWKARALSHAVVIRALMAVKDPPPGTVGARWLEEANETLELGEIRPGVGQRSR